MESPLFLPTLRTGLEPGKLCVAENCCEQRGRHVLWCLLPVGKIGFGCGRLRILVSVASRWKDLSCSERNRARCNTSRLVQLVLEGINEQLALFGCDGRVC